MSRQTQTSPQPFKILSKTFNAAASMSLLGVLAFGLTFSGCKGAQKRDDNSSANSSGSISDSDINSELADSDSGRAGGLQTIHYDYDSSTLSGEARQTLENNAAIMKENSSYKIQVEGHTDERGGIQYNIALGERRANAAKAYLVDKGIDASRITSISYGKEKPLDEGHSEDAWSKNRRANFRLTGK